MKALEAGAKVAGVIAAVAFCLAVVLLAVAGLVWCWGLVA